MDTGSEDRYNRQIILSKWGDEYQQRLGNASVLIVGCGALGTHTASSLSRAGVGKLTLVDRDFVELSNLHRTSLFLESDEGKPKAIVTRDRISRANSDVKIKALTQDLDYFNAPEITKGHDLILDCTDNLLTRYLINDCSVKFDIPWIYAAVIEATGMTFNVLPDDGPCFRCLFPEHPPPGSLPTCDTAGVINTIPQVISSLQVTEAIKYLGKGEMDVGKLLFFDIWNRDLSKTIVNKDDDCLCCGKKEYSFLTGEGGQTTTKVCGRKAVQINPREDKNINLEELSDKLNSLGRVKLNKGLLRLELDEYRINLFEDGRAIIDGTEDEKLAKSLYSRYFGN